MVGFAAFRRFIHLTSMLILLRLAVFLCQRNIVLVAAADLGPVPECCESKSTMWEKYSTDLSIGDDVCGDSHHMPVDLLSYDTELAMECLTDSQLTRIANPSNGYFLLTLASPFNCQQSPDECMKYIIVCITNTCEQPEPTSQPSQPPTTENDCKSEPVTFSVSYSDEVVNDAYSNWQKSIPVRMAIASGSTSNPLTGQLKFMSSLSSPSLPDGWLACDGDDIPTGSDFDDLQQLLAQHSQFGGRLPDCEDRVVIGASASDGIPFGSYGGTDQIPVFSVEHQHQLTADVFDKALCNFDGVDIQEQHTAADSQTFDQMQPYFALSMFIATDMVNTSVFSVGELVMFVGDEDQIPEMGLVPCDGAYLDASEYPVLYSIVETSYGGSSVHFGIPDCRGKALMSTQSAGPPLSWQNITGESQGRVSWQNVPPSNHSTSLLPLQHESGCVAEINIVDDDTECTDVNNVMAVLPTLFVHDDATSEYKLFITGFNQSKEQEATYLGGVVFSTSQYADSADSSDSSSDSTDYLNDGFERGADLISCANLPHAHELELVLTCYDTPTPTEEPTVEPTRHPSDAPSTSPSTRPTLQPTDRPTPQPTVEPTPKPTANPSYEPTTTPSMLPTADPSEGPTIEPTSDPTTTPTVTPTVSPSTDPTVTPSAGPTTEPTSDPTATPSSSPTQNPTQSPTPQRCEFRPSGAQSFQFAIIADNSCGLTEAECTIQKQQIAELLLMIKVDDPPYYTQITYVEYGEDGADLRISLDDAMFQNNLSALHHFILNNATCGQGGNGQTDLISGIDAAMSQFAQNDDGQMGSVCRKIYSFNNCENTAQNTSKLCDELYDTMDFTFEQPIDRVMINVQSSSTASNHITDPEAYLQCLTKPRLGVPTGMICAGQAPQNTDQSISTDEFTEIFGEECLEDGICSEIKRIIPDPTRSPSPSPTPQPVANPTLEPTIAPSVDPTMEPTEITSESPSLSPSVATCDFVPSASQSFQFAIIADNSCGINENECLAQKQQIVDLLQMIKTDAPPFVSEVTYIEFQHTGANVRVALNDTALQNNLTAFAEFIFGDANCDDDGNGCSDLVSGIDAAMAEFRLNDHAGTVCRKIFMLNHCENNIQNTTTEICGRLYDELDFAFDQPIDRVAININSSSSSHNVIVDLESYLQCFIEPRLGVMTGAICAQNSAEEPFDEECVDDGICSQIKRMIPDPTTSPTTQLPTAEPTPRPSPSPSANPSTSPSAEPSTSPTSEPSSMPTLEPTPRPTPDPINPPTQSPTHSPTSGPTDDPTSLPTRTPSADPSSDPTRTPTAAPTPMQCEFRPSDTIAYQFAIVVDNSCGLTEDECREQREQIGDLLLMIKVDSPPYFTQIAYIEYGEHGADVRVGMKDSLQADKGAFYAFVTNGSGTHCGDGGNGQTDLVSGIDVALIHFKDNEEPSMHTVRKIFVVSHCENNVQDTESTVCVTLHNALDFEFAQPIDRVLVNVPGATAANSISDASTYLQCFVAPRLGAATGAICAASEAPWFDEECVDDGICSEIERMIPDPTVSPTHDPSEDPTADPTPDPTLEPTENPTTVPSSQPTLEPSIHPTQTPSNAPSESPSSDPTESPSLNPTESPSSNPTESPSSNPNESPSVSPSTDISSEPTFVLTQSPSFSPTRNPTTSPTPQRCEFRPSGAQSFQFAIVADNSCGLTEAECTIQRDQIAELLLMIKVDRPPFYTRVTYIEFGEDGAEMQVALDDSEFQSNLTLFHEFLLNNAGCGAGGHGQTDLVSGLEVAMAEFARNDDAQSGSICRKIYALNNCENTARNTSTLCTEMYEAMDVTFAQPIDRVMINVPSFMATNSISDPSTYLQCFVAPRLGAATGAICDASETPWFDEECVDDGICSETKRIVPDPTKAPTDRPSSNPTAEPTDGPTHFPSEHPTSTPSANPTVSHTEEPTEAPTDEEIISIVSPDHLMSPASNCEWDSSGNWSACSFFFLSNHSKANACAQYRERECVCQEANGAGCDGSSFEVRECDIECAAEWTAWSLWSECVIQSLDCIADTSGQGICSGFQFRTRSCFREISDASCSCDADEFGTETTSQTRECSTRNCLQIRFENGGDEECAPTWSLELSSDLWVGNHIEQRGGYMGDECVVVEEDVEYLLVIEDGCGAVSWLFQGQEIGEYTFLDNEEFRDKSFQIVVQDRATHVNLS